MTITGGSALPKDDIERMMRDAQDHADEDRQRKEDAETRNVSEALQWQTEKFLAENGDKVDASVRSDVEEKLTSLKAVLGGKDGAAIRSATEELAKASSAMGQSLYANTGAQAGGPGTGPGAGSSGGSEDDVVDAEVIDEEKK